MTYRKWTDEQLIQAVKDNDTISDVVREVGLKSNNSGNHQSINVAIKNLGLDTSHFKHSKYVSASRKKIPTSKILIKNSKYTNTTNLKKRLIKENVLDDKCSECNITNWNDKKLSLHLDHINGDCNDNRLKNLRLLCPNCHSLTPTYCRGMRVKSQSTCIDCKSPTSGSRSVRCSKCSGIKNSGKTKIEWPSNEKLIDMINKSSCSAVGRALGISDNAIRKRLKKNVTKEVKDPESSN